MDGITGEIVEEGKSAVSSERAFADFVFGKGARFSIHFTQIVTFSEFCPNHSSLSSLFTRPFNAVFASTY